MLLAVFAGALSVLYRVAPDRDAPRFSWVSLGAVVVTVVWAIVSVVFSLYVDNFGSYDKTYGAIAGVIVLMLWLHLTCYLVLLGAEINAEAEHQTAQDTTEGEPQPMGTRNADVADTLPDSPNRRKATATRRPAVEFSACAMARKAADDLDLLGPAAHVDGDPRAFLDRGRGVQQGQGDAGAQARGERAARDLAHPAAVAIEHGHARARDAPAGRPQSPQHPRGPGLLLGEQRLPPPERGLLPTHRPAAARLVGRDVQARARARAADSPSRCAGCPGRRGRRAGCPGPAPPRARRPTARPPLGVDQQLVAVLTGVTGAADGDLGRAVRAGAGTKTCRAARRAARAAPAPAAEGGPCTARTATSGAGR